MTPRAFAYTYSFVPTVGQYKPAWPKGTSTRLTKSFAKRFFELLGTSEKSLFGLLQDHPELPSFHNLNTWRKRYPWFNEAWSEARRQQGEFLAQRTLDFANDCTPENAHAQRLKADVYWKVASKFYPAVYGDKPISQPTTVNVGISISPERLSELRQRLEPSRQAFSVSKSLSNGNEKQELASHQP